MLDEFYREIDVTFLSQGTELQGDFHHVQAEHSHPARAVRLEKRDVASQLAFEILEIASIDDGNVVQAEEAAFENTVVFRILLIRPPSEIHKAMPENIGEELRSEER